MKGVVKFFIVLAVLAVVVLGGAAAYLIANINGLIAEYKPELERLASDAVGCSVTFGEISASVFPQTAMVVDEVKVVHESLPDESLTLKNLTLHMELLPLLSKELVINTLSLREPTVTMILDENGIFIAGLPREGAGDSAAGGESGEESAAAAPAIEVHLQHMALEDMTIVLKDTINGTDYSVTDLNMATGIAMEGSAARLMNLDVNGNALDGIDFAFAGGSMVYDLEGGTLEVSSLDGEFLGGNTLTVEGALDPNDSEKALILTEPDTQLASLGPVYDAFAPDLHSLALDGLVSARVRMWLESSSAFNADSTIELKGVEATIGEFQLSELSGPISVSVRQARQKAAAEKLTATIGGAPMDIRFNLDADPQTADLRPLHVDIFGGGADFTMALDLGGSNAFKADMNIADMKVQEMIPALAPDLTVQLSGDVRSVTGDVTGVLDESMTQSLTGQFAMLFKDGVLEEVNVAKETLGKVTEFPFIQGALLQYVPERFNDALLADRTVLNTISGSFALKDEVATTQDMFVESTFFTMEAAGTVGLDSSVDLDSTIFFNKDFSDALITSVGELEYLVDDSGRLAFPVKISGVPPELSIAPDVSDLVQRAVKGAVTKEVTEAIEEEIGESLGEEAGGLLRGILDR